MSESMPTTADGARRAVVLVRHRDDAVLKGASELLVKLSAAAALCPAISIECSKGPPKGPFDDLFFDGNLSKDRFEISSLVSGKLRPADLTEFLHSAGSLERIDIISACSAALKEGTHQDLSDADRTIRTCIQRTSAPQTAVLLHRVWVPDFGDSSLAPPSEFMDSSADRGFVIVPVDREHDKAHAMPLSHNGPDKGTMEWHAAVEIASLAGLWSTMDSTPLEAASPASSGTAAPLVRMVRSMVRMVSVEIPGASPAPERPGSLPLVRRFMADPSPNDAIAKVAPLVLPEAMRSLHDLGPPKTDKKPGRKSSPQPQPAQASHSELMPTSDPIGTRRADEGLSDMPYKTAKDGTAAVEAFLRRTVDKAPWAAELLSETLMDSRDDDHSMRLAKNALERSLPNVSIESVPHSAWDELMGNLFGIADAHPSAEPIRDRTIGSRYLIVDIDALGPRADELSEVLSSLSGQPAPTQNTATEKPARARSDEKPAAPRDAKKPDAQEPTAAKKSPGPAARAKPKTARKKTEPGITSVPRPKKASSPRRERKKTSPSAPVGANAVTPNKAQGTNAQPNRRKASNGSFDKPVMRFWFPRLLPFRLPPRPVLPDEDRMALTYSSTHTGQDLSRQRAHST